MQPATRRFGLRISATAAVGVLLAALSGAAADPASAALVRYAAPTPTGTQDCSSPANACDLKKAATDPAVADGDEVILAPGEYTLTQGLGVKKAIDVHGQGVPSATRIASSAGSPGVSLENAGAKLHDVEIDYGGVFSALFAGEGKVDRVLAISSSTSAGNGCALSGATLLDTVCVSRAATGYAISVNWSGGTHTSVLRNVTGIGAGTNGGGLIAMSNGGTTIAIDAKNVILRGSGTGDDVHASADATSKTVLDLDHSSFSRVFSFAQPGGTSTVTDTAASGNQEAAPLFVNAAAGDYRQAAGSPTIDAGVADPFNGTLDVDEQARTQGAAIDIGADEFTPPAPPGPPTQSSASSIPVDIAPITSLTKHPPRTLRTLATRMKVSFHFTSDSPGARFECSLDSRLFAPCTSPRTLTTKRGRHTFSVRAIAPTGTPDATPATFTWTIKKKQLPHHR